MTTNLGYGGASHETAQATSSPRSASSPTSGRATPTHTGPGLGFDAASQSAHCYAVDADVRVGAQREWVEQDRPVDWLLEIVRNTGPSALTRSTTCRPINDTISRGTPGTSWWW